MPGMDLHVEVTTVNEVKSKSQSTELENFEKIEERRCDVCYLSQDLEFAS